MVVLDTRRPTMVVLLILFIIMLKLDKSHQRQDDHHDHDDSSQSTMTEKDKVNYKEKVVEMFKHAYNSYLDHAYPADELMPLSCKGRYRGSEPSRGDIDDSLGNFTLTMIDTLDTLVILGMLDEFEEAVYMVVGDCNFDTDVVVSVFETNIRILGGLLGAHFMAIDLQAQGKVMLKYKDELLTLAKDIGNRLLPAFNTSTGIPYPRVNLRHGIQQTISRTGHEKDTCTSCAGTMILEFAALSRLTGNKVYEDRARRAMDYIWKQRHRASDLVGTVINIHNGNWVRRESGVGAGIDSYYEYMFKAYILLGDDEYRDRFNTHYDAVMKYVSQGPLLVDVHMHRPESNSRNFMDSLLAFWPGLQVLKGDVRPAIETHEVLYQVMKRHNFLPEAFTTNFRVHWGNHPLRPEFVESTYFLYKATRDPYYLVVGKKAIENMEAHARVKCGYASIKDVTYSTHEDQMDSYVLAETFKYLYLLFSEQSDLDIDLEQYIFTTEAHLLPLSLATYSHVTEPKKLNRSMYTFHDEDAYTYTQPDPPTTRTSLPKNLDDHTCPNSHYTYKGDRNYAHNLRAPLRDHVLNAYPLRSRKIGPALHAKDFNAGDKQQLSALHLMGIRLQTMTDGRVQLLHSAGQAASAEHADDGMRFMQEMIEITKSQQADSLPHEPLHVEVLWPNTLTITYEAGPAQFGYDLKNLPPVKGQIAIASPEQACGTITNVADIQGKIALVMRGGCMFVEKARNLQKAGAKGGIVVDSTEGSSSGPGTPLFAMSGDGSNDVVIPLAFLYHSEGTQLNNLLRQYKSVTVAIYFKKKRNGGNPFTGDSLPKCSMPTPVSTDSHQHTLPIDSTTEEVKVESSTSGTLEAKIEAKFDPTNDESNFISLDSDFAVEDDSLTPRITVPTSTVSDKFIKEQDVYDKVFGENVITIHSEISDGVFVMSFSTKDNAHSMEIVSHASERYPDEHVSLHIDELNNREGVVTKVRVSITSYHSPDLQKPVLSDLYMMVIRLLRENSNFGSLSQQADYLLCLAQAMEAGFFQFTELDNFTQHMFAEFLTSIGRKKRVDQFPDASETKDETPPGDHEMDVISTVNKPTNDNNNHDDTNNNPPGFNDNILKTEIVTDKEEIHDKSDFNPDVQVLKLIHKSENSDQSQTTEKSSEVKIDFFVSDKPPPGHGKTPQNDGKVPVKPVEILQSIKEKLESLDIIIGEKIETHDNIQKENTPLNDNIIDGKTPQASIEQTIDNDDNAQHSNDVSYLTEKSHKNQETFHSHKNTERTLNDETKDHDEL